MKKVLDVGSETIYNVLCMFLWMEKFHVYPEGMIKSKELQQVELEAQISSRQIKHY